MPVHVSAGEVAVIPDAAMLADPATKFPVFIDPSWTGHMAGMWKVVVSHLPDSSTFSLSNGDLNGTAGSGRTCDVSTNGVCQSPEYKVRTMFRMETFGVSGKHVLQATFNISQKWSWTCNPASNAKLWLMLGPISSSTTWNTQPPWDSGHTATASASHRRDQAAGCSGTGNVAFDATSFVQLALASGWPDVTVGLQAADEGNVNQWKRFDASSVSLAMTYNSLPNTPDTLTTYGQGCVTGAGRPVLGTAAPTLSARVTDPDGTSEQDINGSLRGEFAWEQQNLSTGTWSALGSGSGTPQANGTTSPTLAPNFANGGRYRWHVRAADSWSLPNVGSGTDYSAWTGWCEFEVDTTAPNPPKLTPDGANTPFVAGKTVKVTLSPGGSPADSDVTGYTWWVVDGAGTHPVSIVNGSTVTMTWTPIAGQTTIYATARDRAVNTSTNVSYVFTAAQLSPAIAQWPLAEPAGSAVAGDPAGGHDATVALTAPATLGAPGLIIGGPTVLSLNGGSANSVTTAGPIVDTTRNFTVAAWLRVTDTSTSRTAVSQDGVHSTGFQLKYANSCTCWDFVLPDADAVNTSLIGATSSAPPRLNVWTHLTGVYDIATGTARLYVNGVQAGSATRQATPWNATGPLTIGRSRWNDNSIEFFSGGIADVRVWDRALSADEIAAIVDPTDPSNVATATVGQWLIRPEDCPGNPVTFCLDGASMGHDLGLSGGVTITTAGQSGSALLFNGTDGVAQTTEGNPGPVLHTDQSFTVSTWVKLGNVPTHNYTALGQDGNYVSAFYLGYRIFGGTTPRWSFSMKDIDSDASGVTWMHAYAPATLTAADVGKWVHLVGVYDAATGGMSLYVDGALAGTATRTATPWDATGPMTIGTAWYTQPGGTPGLVDHWNGTIDTVTVYAGAVPATSINRIP
jgi:hypothetical protein